jgi:hypothetical protein
MQNTERPKDEREPVKNIQWAPEMGKEHWPAVWAAIAAVRSNSTEVDCDLHPSRTPKDGEL